MTTQKRNGKNEADRAAMMTEIARMKPNLRDRQNRHMQNQALLQDHRNVSYQGNVVAKYQEETVQIKQAKSAEWVKIVSNA
jgi:hypothetical protein